MLNLREFCLFTLAVTQILAGAELIVSQDGSSQYKTISEAVAAVKPGDTILVHDGIYREIIELQCSGTQEKPITIKAVNLGKAIVRGSNVWSNPLSQDKSNPNIYRLPMPSDDFWGNNPNPFLRRLNVAPIENTTPARPSQEVLLPYTLGQIFCDGESLTEARTETAVLQGSGSWFVTPDGTEILIHYPRNKTPENSLLEISVRDRILVPARRGLSHIRISGFIFEHCANQGPWPQSGMVSTRSGSNWIIENNIIRYAKTVGLDFGREFWKESALRNTIPNDRHGRFRPTNNIIRNNIVSDNGLCGITCWQSEKAQVYGNLVERNNNLGLTRRECRWEEYAGIKLLEATSATVECNIVRFNGASGIWLDNNNQNARVSRNVIYNNAGCGIFIEFTFGPIIIDNNIIANTTRFEQHQGGFGIYTLDASGVKIYHNLFLDNATTGIYFCSLNTKRDFHGRLVKNGDHEIRNNIFSGNGNNGNGGGVTLPYPNPRSQNCISDGNIFHRFNPVYFRFAETGTNDFFMKDILKLHPGKLSKREEQNALSRNQLRENLWVKITGWEKNSTFLDWKKADIHFKPFELSLQIRNDAIIPAQQYQPTASDKDFFGIPRIADKIVPGPFQNLQKGMNYFLLTFPTVQ